MIVYDPTLTNARSFSKSWFCCKKDYPGNFRRGSLQGVGRVYWNQRGVSRRRSASRSEEHTSELQSRGHIVCRLLLEKKKNRPQWNRVSATSQETHCTQT